MKRKAAFKHRWKNLGANGDAGALMGGTFRFTRKKSRGAMLIEEAITAASTEHAVMFLLTAYVETLQWYEHTSKLFNAHVARLPIGREADVIARVAVLHELVAADRYVASVVRPLLEEACDVFTAALNRLHTLARPSPEGKRLHLFQARLPHTV